jgi:tRNA(fMet)-specific endonuclease VapC
LIFLLDTNAVSAILKERPKHVRQRFRMVVERGDSVALPIIVRHELHYGARRSPNPPLNFERLDALLSQLSEAEPFTIEDAEISGDLRAELAARGEMIGPYDLLIAAQALRLKATLVTANVREFSRVPGLAWEDWSSETVVRGEPER